MVHTYAPLLGAVYITYLLIAGVSADIPAQGLPQFLHARAVFNGGWPLAAQICPSGSTQCGRSDLCCPSSTMCHAASSWVCCPDTRNCAPIAKTFPACADPSWQLYRGEVDYFCCGAGQKGALPGNDTRGKGLCVVEDQQLSMTQSATKVSQVIITTSVVGDFTLSSAATSTSVRATTTTAQSASVTSATTRATSTGSAEKLVAEGPLAVVIGSVGSLLLMFYL